MSSSTLKDIAKALNLSVSSVSRALRDSYEISPETKAKVLAYANSVNYRPNPVALSLKENKSHSICVIVPEISNNFFSEVINGIESVAIERGYHVMIFQTHEKYEREQANLEHGLARRVDGIIMSLSGNTTDFEHLKKFEQEKIPVVFFDRVPTMDNFHKVVADNFEGAYNGTKYLISKGKRKIAHITSPPMLSITKERLAGYKACLADFSIEYDENLVKYCGFESQDAQKAIETIIFEHQPDSFFLGSDRLALYALEVIKKNKKHLAEPIEIVGFTNIKSANLLAPVLNTIRQPAFEMGEKAASLLINTIEAKNKVLPFQKIVLKTELIIRDLG